MEGDALSNRGARETSFGRIPQVVMRPALPRAHRRAEAGERGSATCGVHDVAPHSLRAARSAAVALLLVVASGPVAFAQVPARDSSAIRTTRGSASERRASAADSLAAVDAAASTPAPPAAAAAPPVRSGLIVPEFPVPPLAPPLVVTGMFGERRPRHFHAGLDLSTGGVIGKPVRAPIDGWIERIHTQGIGYGRSLYLHTRTGLTLVFGHLDAFAEPIASYLAAVQDSSGQYEQDLWPPRDRFPVTAGQMLAWSGKSGTGEPHLHIEVRRGDMGLNPLRAGIPVADAITPEFRTVTLEPLDENSRVAGGEGPLTRPLGVAREETLVVVGRMRALARAIDPGERGAILAPWRLRATWGGEWVEWCADSASWATDMVDVDYVYDVGRANPTPAPEIQLWAPPRWRPRLLRTNVPDSLAAGLIEVRPGDPARPLRFTVEDAAGHVRERTVWLRGPRASDPPGIAERLARASSGRRRRRGAEGGARGGIGPGEFRYTALPNENLRVVYRGGPADLVSAAILGVPATRRGAEWTAIVSGARIGDVLRPAISGLRRRGVAWGDSARPLAVARTREPHAFGGPLALQWKSAAHDAFEPALLFYDPVGRPAPGTAELTPLSDQFAFEPADLPLRSGIAVRLVARAAPLDERAGLYVYDEGWSFVGSRDEKDPARAQGDTRELGSFAVLADTVAPRVRPLRTPRRAPLAPYSQWALRAKVAEFGSGLDTRGTFFTVDGKRVPTECDAVRDLLVWRPLARPARGTHHYVLEARDRAGNVRRTGGTFVLD